MPWSAPISPVSGSVITVAWATTNIVNTINWLRTMTGGADPSAADKVLVSLSPTSTAWGTVPDAGMTNQKVNSVSPTYSTFAAAAAGNSGLFFIPATSTDGPSSGIDWHVLQMRWPTFTFDYRMQFACNLLNSNDLYIRTIANGVAGAWRRIWNAGNMGSGGGLDADTLDTHDASYFATAASVAAINQVPSGLGGFFATAAGIASGWTRYTAADGRSLIGAGTTFSQTFTENTAVGANWTPFAGASVITSTAADVTGAASSGSAFSAPSHQHTVTMAAQTWTPVARIVVWATKN